MPEAEVEGARRVGRARARREAHSTGLMAFKPSFAALVSQRAASVGARAQAQPGTGHGARRARGKIMASRPLTHAAPGRGRVSARAFGGGDARLRPVSNAREWITFTNE